MKHREYVKDQDFFNLIPNEFNIYDFVVGDIESPDTDENGNFIFKYGCLTDGLEIYTFDNIDIFFALIKQLQKPIYFHNLDFDLLFFLKSAFASGITDTPIINSGNMIISINLYGVIFKNSLSLFPMALKDVVSKFAQIVDKDYLNEKQNVLTLDDETLINYCKKDVIYLYYALSLYYDFTNEFFDMNPSLTTPATSFKIFKKHFLKEEIKESSFNFYNRHSFFDNGYYFGGHTEKFVNDKFFFKDLRYYDINSLYPYMMYKTRFIKSKLRSIKPTITNIKRLHTQKRLFFCEIDLKIDSEYLRAFPVLDIKNKSNKYPFGIHRIKISEVGIDFIMKWGSIDNIVHIERILTQEKETDELYLFQSFVEFFYKLRFSSPKWVVLAKLILNSLYGKFGEKLKKQIKIINATKEFLDDKELHSYGKYDDVFIHTIIEEMPFYKKLFNRLDISGKITEAARLHMMDIINEIRIRYGIDSVIYTDTDSIIMYDNDIENDPELSHFFDNDTKELGKLSDEIGYKDDAYILGFKMYHFKNSNKKATKGVRNLEYNDFIEISKNLVKGKGTQFDYQRFTKFATFVRKGIFGLQKVPYEYKNILQRLDII